MNDYSLGGLSSEIVCMLDRASTNKTIKYFADEYHHLDDGKFGKIIEGAYIETGAVHQLCQADIIGTLEPHVVTKDCEIKSKNLKTKSNDINIAEFKKPANADGVNMFYQAYDKIKDSLCYMEYEVVSDVIIVKRITLYQDLPIQKFKSNIRINGMSFDINKNKLKKMYKKTTPIVDDL
tara:strand:- start:49 stop:585 length:537 start_codon:yes stop_codon:yes gene_type:complete